MTAIFLDVDGVLNSNSHIIHTISKLGRKKYIKLLNKIGHTPFDPRCVKLVRKLIKKTKSVVVLSSTWRLSKEDRKAVEKQIKNKLYGLTPILGFENPRRGTEISNYLDEHKEIDNYLILDDDSDMLDNQFNNFIKIDREEGFSKKDYLKGLEILKK